MSSKKEQSEMQYKTEQLKLQLYKKDVLLMYIYMFKIQKALYAIEHLSHVGLTEKSKQELIEEEIAKIKESLDDIFEGLDHHHAYITTNMEVLLFNKLASDMKELIREVKSDIELTGEFHQCVVDTSDKILKLLKRIEDDNESRNQY